MAKITVSFIREIMAQLDNEQISFSRFVELINERAEQNDEVWAAGNVECDICGHNWIAVRLQSTEKIECPRCHNMSTH